ncbi:hypothetical protein HGM15179_010975 [Zosterops borbonicus]|uniref:Uncharacterized protein n=1 Tax=Zosterops borbonicus TaxID=364589 RepID=A0A8K1GCZ0_9PASS|nr:hypothetical protein HGM15179_010975 [Zosterops borbonicus]
MSDDDEHNWQQEPDFLQAKHTYEQVACFLSVHGDTNQGSGYVRSPVDIAKPISKRRTDLSALLDEGQRQLKLALRSLWRVLFISEFSEHPDLFLDSLGKDYQVGLDNQENPTPDIADYKSSTEFTGVQNFSVVLANWGGPSSLEVNVVFIYKKDWKKDLGNYRAVHLILVLGKIMEQIILSAITYSDPPDGSGKGCECVVYLSSSKAFDTMEQWSC